MNKRRKIIEEMILIETKVSVDQVILKSLRYTESYDEVKTRMRNNMLEHMKLGQVLLKRDLSFGLLMLSIQIAIIGFVTYGSILAFKRGWSILGYFDIAINILNIFNTLKFSRSHMRLQNLYDSTNKLLKDCEEKDLQNIQNNI